MRSGGKPNYKEIGKRIRKARETKGWTQSQLGMKLTKKLTATAISLYEKGEREVKLDVLAEIATALDTTIETLITGDKGFPKPQAVKVALRADKKLHGNERAQEQILDFIKFVKEKVESEEGGPRR